MGRPLVDRGVIVFVGAPMGGHRRRGFLIRPRRFLEVAERVAELAERLKARVELSG